MFSLIESLFTDPIWFLEYSLYRIPAVLIAMVLHEWAHGYAALRCGDPTALRMGRLTLNPLKHLDPLGAFFMFFMGFGWAKPVPVNASNFKRPRRDDLLVSVAGVTVNFLIFILSTLALVFLSRQLWQPWLFDMVPFQEVVGFQDCDAGSVFCGLRSDGSPFSILFAILGGNGPVFSSLNLFARPGLLWAVRLAGHVSLINIGIAIFNLVPIPPLDGYHVLNDLVLKGNLFASGQIANIGRLAVYVLMFTGVLGNAMNFAVNAIQGGLLRVVLPVFGG